MRFFKDNFNARFCWTWPEEGFVVEDSALIENYIGLGLRYEEVNKVKIKACTVEVTVPMIKKAKRTRNKKAS